MRMKKNISWIEPFFCMNVIVVRLLFVSVLHARHERQERRYRLADVERKRQLRPRKVRKGSQ